MKIVVNIALLLILLALLALAVTIPRKWTEQGSSTAEPGEPSTFVIREETDQTPPERTPPTPDIATKEKPEPKPNQVAPSEIIKIVSKLQNGETDEAALLVNDVVDSLDDDDAVALQSIVSTETARAEQLELLSNQLTASKQELNAVEHKSRKALEESLRTLAAATKLAEDATAESEKLTRELEKKVLEEIAEAEAAQPEPPLPKEAIKLPENDLIDFSFGSTFLNDANKKTLSKTVKLLKERDELAVQLRGHTDTIGEPQYNAILANARCEMARDFLIEQGIEISRISIVSFGESQVFKEGVVAEKPRRVEILYRPRS